MSYLKIQSKGEIDVKAFTLLGGSTKTGDSSKIGMYGSGLKYSISTLLRNNIKFKVFSGVKELTFETKNDSFRDKEFELILVNGQQTSFTTSMGGSDWDNPFAPLREIYSNALDEDDDASLEEATILEGEFDTTTFYIEMTLSVKDFYDNIGLYFCTKNSQVLFANEYGAVYNTNRGDLRLFRKGILSHHSKNLITPYAYNSPNFRINESRVIRSMSDAAVHVGRIWKACKNERYIVELINLLAGGNTGTYEHTLSFKYETYTSDRQPRFSKEWGNIVRNMKFCPVEIAFLYEENRLSGRTILPLSFLDALKEDFEGLDILGGKKSCDGDYFSEAKAPEILVNKVIETMAILNKTRYKYRLDNTEIQYVKFSDKDTLGSVSEERILLSVSLAEHSKDEIAKTIIEENEHIKSGYIDRTRAYQNHLLNLFYDELTS